MLLYVLGLSYGAVADMMSAWNVQISKTTAYNNVQELGIKSRDIQEIFVKRSGKRAVIGSDGTYVKVKGEKVGLQIVVDDKNSELLGLEIIVSENKEEVLEIINKISEQVDADILVSDDLDTYKGVADEIGLEHQTCRNHIKRNVDALAEDMQLQLKKKEICPPGVDSSPVRLVEDLEGMQNLIRERPKTALEQLETLYHRYKAAPSPKKGQRHTVWYRMRMLITRRWENWPRLVLDQQRGDMDGTNNSSERLIGWWIKERYRSMRGYKRIESIKNVVTLTARMGVRSGHYDMTELFA